MGIIATYTEWGVGVPEWFIQRIGEEFAKYDLAGATNGRIQGIIPTGEHPLVQLTGQIFGGGQPSFAGLLPAVSVIESDENDENTYMGQGLGQYKAITQEFMDALKTDYPTMNSRINEGLITDKQISDIEQHIANNGGQALVQSREFRVREAVFISLWAHNLQERQIIGRILRSILYKFN